MPVMIRQTKTKWYYHGNFKGIPLFSPYKSAAHELSAHEAVRILRKLNKFKSGWCELYTE
jgi:hypothetical protein